MSPETNNNHGLPPPHRPSPSTRHEQVEYKIRSASSQCPSPHHLTGWLFPGFVVASFGTVIASSPNGEEDFAYKILLLNKVQLLITNIAMRPLHCCSTLASLLSSIDFGLVTVEQSCTERIESTRGRKIRVHVILSFTVSMPSESGTRKLLANFDFHPGRPST